MNRVASKQKWLKRRALKASRSVCDICGLGVLTFIPDNSNIKIKINRDGTFESTTPYKPTPSYITPRVGEIG